MPSPEKTVSSCLISCGILREEVDALIRTGDLELPVRYLPSALHTDYGLLEKGLRGAIQKEKARGCERPVILYGDLCLGFHGEMRALMEEFGAVKVDALNCIDCLLGGHGRLLEIDPEHKLLFLTPGFVEFAKTHVVKDREGHRGMYSMLDGIVVLDSLGNLEEASEAVHRTVERTGLPFIRREAVGVERLKRLILETLEPSAG